MNDPLRHMVDTLGLRRVLADLAAICTQAAEEDLTFRPDWALAATRLIKLSHKTHENL